MHFENLTFAVEDGLARLTLNRPKAANSFNIGLTREFFEVATICADDSAIRAVLLTGAGRFFSAGGDLKNFAAAGDQVPKMVSETSAIVSMTRTSDGREGVAAFREKRRPNFKGA